VSNNKDTRSWVWYSNPASLRDGTLTVLAITETIAATALGIWLWFHIGVYPLLLSSAVMAFLTMLRSDASIEKGSRWFTAYEKQFSEDTAPRWLIVLSITVATLASGLLSYWLATLWLPDYSGWPLFWRSALLGLLAMNVGIAVAVSVAAAAAVVAAVAAAAVAAVAVAGTGMIGAALTVAIVAATSLGAAAASIETEEYVGSSPGFAFGVFLRAMATRMLAVMCHIPTGLGSIRNSVYGSQPMRLKRVIG